MNVFIALLFAAAATAVAANNSYQAEINLNALTNDQLPVSLVVPSVSEDSVTFVFPQTVPGTYEEHLWWRLVLDFKAFDASGNQLPVHRSIDSQFVIRDAQRLHRVAYRLNDSFDDKDQRVSIFHPAGTSFQGDSVFVFNHAGIVGYIEGYQKHSYEMRVTKPSALYCATALEIDRISDEVNVYRAESYDALVDGPAMFAEPDTASFVIDGVEVLVAIYHSRDKKIANAYADELYSVCNAIGTFLPSMPVDRYAFLLYLWEGDTSEVYNGGRAFGALEHSYSSFYFWRYASKPFGLDAVAAHEFLHILMPLNLHSEEIADFNFRKPLWSGHLWLYEGVTEYFADQALLRGKTLSESRYVQRLQQAASTMRYLPDSFNLFNFSKDVISAENQRVYPLIYQYGPLNALCLDILIREETSNEKGLLEVVYELTERYGKNKPFKDEDLFDNIADLTSSKVRDYCAQYIDGNKRVPLAEFLPKIGLEFQDSVEVQKLSFGVEFNADRSSSDSVFIGPGVVNPLGLETDDRLIKINDTDLNEGNQYIARRLWRTTSEEPIKLTVVRNGVEVDLEAKPVVAPSWEYNRISETIAPSDETAAFRKSVWFGSAE